MTSPQQPHSPPEAEETTLERKPLQTFVLHAFFLTLLFSLLPSLDSAYGYGFAASGNAVLGNLGSDLTVLYRWVPPNERVVEGEISMEGYLAGYERPVWESRYSVRDRGYQPTVLLIALILATPASRRRHVLACVLGALALGAFYLAQTGLLATCLFASFRPDAVLFGETLKAMRPGMEAVFGSPLVRYAAVLAVWAVVAAPARGLDMTAATERIGTLLRGSKPRGGAA